MKKKVTTKVLSVYSMSHLHYIITVSICVLNNVCHNNMLPKDICRLYMINSIMNITLHKYIVLYMHQRLPNAQQDKSNS